MLPFANAVKLADVEVHCLEVISLKPSLVKRGFIGLASLPLQAHKGPTNALNLQ